MNLNLVLLEGSISNKKTLRSILEKIYPGKKLIRFFISQVVVNSICIEILISD